MLASISEGNEVMRKSLLSFTEGSTGPAFPGTMAGSEVEDSGRRSHRQ